MDRQISSSYYSGLHCEQCGRTGCKQWEKSRTPQTKVEPKAAWNSRVTVSVMPPSKPLSAACKAYRAKCYSAKAYGEKCLRKRQELLAAATVNVLPTSSGYRSDICFITVLKKNHFITYQLDVYTDWLQFLWTNTIYTVSGKKGPTLFLLVTLRNANRFLKLFYHHTLQ